MGEPWIPKHPDERMLHGLMSMCMETLRGKGADSKKSFCENVRFMASAIEGRPVWKERRAVSVTGFQFHHHVVRYKLAPHGSRMRVGEGQTVAVFAEYCTAIEVADRLCSGQDRYDYVVESY